jgi:hypothetical protein
MARTLKGVTPTLYEMPEHRRKKKFEWAILAVAVFLLAKAEVLFSMVVVAAGHAAANVLPTFYLQPLVALFTERRIFDQDTLNDSILWIILVIAVFYAVIGTGLLLRLSWTRLTVMAVSGLEVVALLRLAIVPAMDQQRTLSLSTQIFLIAIVIADFVSIITVARRFKAFEHRNNRIFEDFSG